MKLLLVILFSFCAHLSFAQCNGFQEENCELPFSWPYEYDSQSMATGMFPGQAFRIKAVLYEGYDYYLGFCKQEDLGGLQLKITIEDQTFDQSYTTEENSNLQYIELSMQKTTIAIIEIKLNKTQNISYHTNDIKCVGIIIGNKETEE